LPLPLWPMFQDLSNLTSRLNLEHGVIGSQTKSSTNECYWSQKMTCERFQIKDTRWKVVILSIFLDGALNVYADGDKKFFIEIWLNLLHKKMLKKHITKDTFLVYIGSLVINSILARLNPQFFYYSCFQF